MSQRDPGEICVKFETTCEEKCAEMKLLKISCSWHYILVNKQDT